MSILHANTVFVAAKFLPLTGGFVTAGTRGGDCDWNLMPRETD